ncbi:hypothetical protein EUTSA_v10016339mg [Eutrema salsugineum]|uniref:Histone-lysine N-methyltransferase n=2 Tax=Eutrema salsugineum TaxID=72664 RepID=V4MHV5_EUTSA|nr:hypothetical protein EUTSA_v10016339mg [Eutrema salsugineum]
MNLAGDDCVPSSEARVELIPGENVGERHHLKSVDEKPVSNCLRDEDEKFVFASKDEVVGSVCRRSIVGTKQLRGRKISIVRDIPPNTESKFSENGKTMKDAVSMEDKNLVLEKNDSGDHLGQSLAKKSISPDIFEPLELEKSKVTVSKPNVDASRRVSRSSVVKPSPLKLSKKMNGDYGCGLPPSRPSDTSSGDSARHKVKETLRLFNGLCRKILQEEEARPRERNGSKFRVDFEASKKLKSEGKYFNNGTHIMGPVPGVEVGDEFQYRMELNILGIHRPTQGGIDFMKDDHEELVATSIVASGGYDDELDKSDVLIYTGQGGNVIKRGKKNNQPKDQQLVKGNLALANSKDKKNPVRVVRGNQKTALESSDVARNYVYDGLYVVEEFWKETGSHGKLIFKFKLRRIPGQPELSWRVLKKTKTSRVRDGLCCDDISKGKERLPICAVNDVDDEKPPPFIYTVKMIYPDWCRPIPPKGCGCQKRCTESRKCACVSRNGGELPYNYDGGIVNAKPLVYECGPLCKCPPDCYLRVTQSGIRFQLEIFKTESRGWGVRSLDSIPIGSFICEYAGELLQEKEAERLSGKDEYLFDIGKDHEMTGFTIDAARKGNIGRFINHSCSPNLYAQDVLYDHEDTRIPHVMLFAMDNIPPLEELSYHYNYKLDQVRDLNGNIRKKNCYCGSSECTGRLY